MNWEERYLLFIYKYFEHLPVYLLRDDIMQTKKKKKKKNK